VYQEGRKGDKRTHRQLAEPFAEDPIRNSGRLLRRDLHDGAPKRLAVAAGWGHRVWNWYLYPLLGAGLQNRVLYIPVTRSGRIIDYRLEQELLAEADFASWVARLREEKVDVVVALAPVSIEDAWMRAHPELFTRIASSVNGLSRAYRLNREPVP
jgi:hypothetical protein